MAKKNVNQPPHFKEYCFQKKRTIISFHRNAFVASLTGSTTTSHSWGFSSFFPLPRAGPGLPSHLVGHSGPTASTCAGKRFLRSQFLHATSTDIIINKLTIRSPGMNGGSPGEGLLLVVVVVLFDGLVDMVVKSVLQFCNWEALYVSWV